MSGIVYNSGNGVQVSIPLEQVRVKAIIVDTSARVSLTQKYINQTDTRTGRCKYRFPVPAGGAICAFSMHTSDGRTVLGVSKEKDQAREEFEEAISAGKFTGTIEYVTDDIFTISIGCISAHATVEIKLIYVMSLSNDDNLDEIRFQLPLTIGDRYGVLPPDLMSSMAPNIHARVELTVDIQTSGRIPPNGITSPSHSESISESRYPTNLGRPSRRRATIRFQSESYLDQDFVLIIHAEGLDAPRCFAELEHDPSGGLATLAMQLTIVPKFNLPPIRGQEYIFVIDRSGSMDGTRIETAKRTLAILLRMLPAQETFFNVFSFGSDTNSLWEHSWAYNQRSLNIASTHIDSMQADYGGTEIRKALLCALGACSRGVPTAIFVLTDGEAYDIGPTCEAVRDAVRTAPAQGPIRVFTLGIGGTVSSAMCEGIAQAGNGVCLLAIDTERILGKCARLFRAGRTPFVKNVTVDWGIPPDHLSANTPSADFANQFLSLPTIQQAPTMLSDIHAGTRINIFAILSLREMNVPKMVTLHGELDNGSGSFQLTVPIKGVQLKDREPGVPLVHTLAAWRLIQEHQEKKAPLPQPVTTGSNDDIRGAIIVRLGEKYQLASQYTSFIAVDSGQHDRGQSQIIGQDSPLHTEGQSTSSSEADLPLEDTSYGFRARLASNIRTILSMFGFGTAGFLGRTVPGSWPESDTLPPSHTVDHDDEYDSTKTFSSISSLEGPDDWSDWSPPPSPRLSAVVPDEDRSPSPQLEPGRLAPEEERMLLPPKPLPVPPPPPPPMGQEVLELMKLQQFDGSFLLRELRNIIGANAVDEANNLQVDDNVWATALSIAFITKFMGSQRELLDDLLVKAYEFLEGADVSMDSEVLHYAREIVS